MNTQPMRLDEAGATFPYVYETREWLHRCARRMLELDPELDPIAAMHVVDGMAVSSRWRLMLPEAVAEALYEDCGFGRPGALGTSGDRGSEGA